MNGLREEHMVGIQTSASRKSPGLKVFSRMLPVCKTQHEQRAVDLNVFWSFLRKYRPCPGRNSKFQTITPSKKESFLTDLIWKMGSIFCLFFFINFCDSQTNTLQSHWFTVFSWETIPQRGYPKGYSFYSLQWTVWTAEGSKNMLAAMCFGVGRLQCSQ